MYPETITASRVRLERCDASNADPLEVQSLFDADDPAVTGPLTYLPWEPHRTPYDSREWIREQDRRWEAAEGATYLIRATEAMDERTGALGGVVALETEWERRRAEQVVFLAPSFRGRSVYAECAYELLELTFDRLDLEVSIGDAVAGNERARTLWERAVDTFAGQYDGVVRNQFPTDDGARDVHRFSITREQYREAMGIDAAEEGDEEAAGETAGAD